MEVAALRPPVYVKKESRLGKANEANNAGIEEDVEKEIKIDINNILLPKMEEGEDVSIKSEPRERNN